MTDDRYQNQPWYIRLWRRRFYLTIPYYAVKIWLTTSWDEMPFKHCWGLAVGDAQLMMEWYYTDDEVRSYLDDRRKK